MDELERQLKQDAGEIEATVSPQLRARIDASLHAARDSQPVKSVERTSTSLWWMSSLTGLVAALLVIAFFNLNREDTGQAAPGSDNIAETPPTYVERPFAETFPLEARPAVLTSPLEKELDDLQSDLEKVRENVEEDIRLAF